MVFIPSLLQFDVHSSGIRFGIKINGIDPWVIAAHTQIEIHPDKKVETRYRSSKAVLVPAGHHTFRSFPPRPVVNEDTSI
jgi:hypothetical protein